jgi:hypothetical protein
MHTFYFSTRFPFGFPLPHLHAYTYDFWNIFLLPWKCPSHFSASWMFHKRVTFAECTEPHQICWTLFSDSDIRLQWGVSNAILFFGAKATVLGFTIFIISLDYPAESLSGADVF